MKKINHPFLFIIIYFGVGGVLSSYGIFTGTALLIDIFLGVGLYALIVFLFLKP